MTEEENKKPGMLPLKPTEHAFVPMVEDPDCCEKCWCLETTHRQPESAAPLPQPDLESWDSPEYKAHRAKLGYHEFVPTEGISGHCADCGGSSFDHPAPLPQERETTVETTFNNLTFKETEQELGNLLAIIHRDGGHHTQRVGFRQSVRDAHEVWAKLQEEIEELKSSRYDGID